MEELVHAMATSTDARALHDMIKLREEDLKLLVCGADGYCDEDRFDRLLANLEAPQHTVAVVHLFDAYVRTIPERDAPKFRACCIRLTAWLAGAAADQLKLIPRTVATLCHRVAALACAPAQPSVAFAASAVLPCTRAAFAVAPLSLLASKLTCAASASVLVPAHADVLQCCLVAKHYAAGAAFLKSANVSCVASSSETAVQPTDLLRYFYYAGCVSVGTHDWRDAADQLCSAVCAPAQAVSAISVAAFKKLVFVELLRLAHLPQAPAIGPRAAADEARPQDGVVEDAAADRRAAPADTRVAAATRLPKYAPAAVATRSVQGASKAYWDRRIQRNTKASTVCDGPHQRGKARNSDRRACTPRASRDRQARHMRQHAAAYYEIADSFERGDLQKLRDAIALHRAAVEADGNSGLAQQLPHALQRRLINQLTRSYLNLSLADVARRCGLPSPAAASKVLAAMVDAGEIEAQIDEAAQRVSFEAAPPPDAAAAVLLEQRHTEALAAELAKASDLGALLEVMAERVATNTAYVSKTSVADRDDAAGPESPTHAAAPDDDYPAGAADFRF